MFDDHHDGLTVRVRESHIRLKLNYNKLINVRADARLIIPKGPTTRRFSRLWETVSH
jgi:hypothetical protein